jgi:hypothetical protein
MACQGLFTLPTCLVSTAAALTPPLPPLVLALPPAAPDFLAPVSTEGVVDAGRAEGVVPSSEGSTMVWSGSC